MPTTVADHEFAVTELDPFEGGTVTGGQAADEAAAWAEVADIAAQLLVETGAAQRVNQ